MWITFAVASVEPVKIRLLSGWQSIHTTDVEWMSLPEKNEGAGTGIPKYVKFGPNASIHLISSFFTINFLKISKYFFTLNMSHFETISYKPFTFCKQDVVFISQTLTEPSSYPTHTLFPKI